MPPNLDCHTHRSSAGFARATMGVSGAPGAADVDRSAGFARATMGVSGAPGAADEEKEATL